MTASAFESQWQFTSAFEGVISHMYLDTIGMPTVGAGFALPTERACLALPWLPDIVTALTDYRAVRNQPRGRKAQWYGQFCTSHLASDAIRQLFDERMSDFRKSIARHWQLDTLPELAQVALLDMSYNLGAAGLAKYLQLAQAVRARDWSSAAAHCHRRGISSARNEATAELFMTLARQGTK